MCVAQSFHSRMWLLWVKLLTSNLQLRLIPMLTVLYLLAYLDKTNIGKVFKRVYHHRGKKAD
jgi:hypothetical protein